MNLGSRILVLAILLSPLAASAQPQPPAQPTQSPQLALCSDISRLFDALPACTALIDAKTTTPADLLAARIARGNIYGTVRQFDRAIIDYTEALKQKPDLPQVLVNRGISYDASRQGPKAVADFDRAIQLAPNLPTAYAARGGYYGRNGDVDRALPDLDTAVRLRPEDAGTRLNRGAALAIKGDHARAVADFDQAIARQPSPLAYYNRCTSRAILGLLPEALSDCNQALFLNSNYPDVIASRGLVYLRMNQPDDAIRDYNLILQLQPKLAPALYGRGLAKLLKNDKPGAQADMDAAKKLDPGIVATFKQWGIPAS